MALSNLSSPLEELDFEDNLPPVVVFAQLSNLLMRQNDNMSRMIELTKKGNEIMAEVPTGSILIENFIEDMRVQWKAWRILDVFEERQFPALLQAKAERLLLSCKGVGAQMDYDLFRAIMANLRMKIQMDHGVSVAELRAAQSPWTQQTEDTYQTKKDRCKYLYEHERSYYLLKGFVHPIGPFEIDQIRDGEALRRAYESLGWQALSDAKMSTREKIQWAVEHNFRKCGCKRRRCF